jgi:hypothetical protein
MGRTGTQPVWRARRSNRAAKKSPGEVSGVEVRLMRAPSLTKAERLRNRAKTIGEQRE